MGFLSSLKPKPRSGAVKSSSSGGAAPTTNVPNRQSQTAVEDYSTPTEDCSIPEPNFLAPKALILPDSRQGSFTTAHSLTVKTPYSTKPRVRTPADLAGVETSAAGGSASDGDSVLGEDSASSSRMLPNSLLSEAKAQDMMKEELSRTNSATASPGHGWSIHPEGSTNSRLGTAAPVRNFANNVTFHRNKSLVDNSYADSPKSLSHVSFRMMPSNKSLQYSRSGKSAGSTSGSSSNAWAEYSSSSAGMPTAAAAAAADEDLLIAAMDSCLDSLTAAVQLAKADSKPKGQLGTKEPLQAKQRMAAAAAEFHRSTSGGRNNNSSGGGGSSGGGSGGGGSRVISTGGAATPFAAAPAVTWSGALQQPSNSASTGVTWSGAAKQPSNASTPAVSWNGTLQQPSNASTPGVSWSGTLQPPSSASGPAVSWSGTVRQPSNASNPAIDHSSAVQPPSIASTPGVSWSGAVRQPTNASSPAVSWSGTLQHPGNRVLGNNPKGLTVDAGNHSLDLTSSSGAAAAAAATAATSAAATAATGAPAAPAAIGGGPGSASSSSSAGGALINPGKLAASNSSGDSGGHVVVSVDSIGSRKAPSGPPEQLVASQASRNFELQDRVTAAVDPDVMPSTGASGGVSSIASVHRNVSPQQDGYVARDYSTQQNLSSVGQATQQQQQQQQEGVLGLQDGVMSAATLDSGSRSTASDAHTAVDMSYSVPTSAGLQQSQQQQQQQQPQQQQDLKGHRLNWSPSQQQQRVQPHNQSSAGRLTSSTGSSGSRVVYNRDSNDSSKSDSRGAPVAAGAPTSSLAPQPPTAARSTSRRPSATAAKAKAVGRVYGIV